MYYEVYAKVFYRVMNSFVNQNVVLTVQSESVLAGFKLSTNVHSEVPQKNESRGVWSRRGGGGG